MEQSNLLLQAIMLVASTHGGAPTVVLGVFNFSKSDSGVLQRVLESSCWTDALCAFARLPDSDTRVHGPFRATSLHTGPGSRNRVPLFVAPCT